MIISPGLRKFALAAHLTLSVGWIGAVAAYLALDVATATSQDVRTLRAAYLGMELIAWNVIVPLALDDSFYGELVYPPLGKNSSFFLRKLVGLRGAEPSMHVGASLARFGDVPHPLHDPVARAGRSLSSPDPRVGAGRLLGRQKTALVRVLGRVAPARARDETLTQGLGRQVR